MTPYIGFGNGTLAKQRRVKAGVSILAKCGHWHILEDSDPPLLLFYQCEGKSYLAGIGGRLIDDIPADVSGEVEL